MFTAIEVTTYSKTKLVHLFLNAFAATTFRTATGSGSGSGSATTTFVAATDLRENCSFSSRWRCRPVRLLSSQMFAKLTQQRKRILSFIIINLLLCLSLLGLRQESILSGHWTAAMTTTKPDSSSSSSLQQRPASSSLPQETSTSSSTSSFSLKSSINAGDAGCESSDSPFFPNWDHYHFCTSKDHNVVLPRYDAYLKNRPKLRKFSLNPYDFRPMVATTKNPKPLCLNVTDTLLAIKYGQRFPDPAPEKTDADRKSAMDESSSPTLLSPLEKEMSGTYFLPESCRIPYTSPRQLCATLNQFSQVVLIGDSIMRHIRQAMYMTLRNNDLIVGGILSSSEIPYNKCHCDGQFSEHLDCRLNDLESFHQLRNPLALSVCSHLPMGSTYPAPFQLLSEPNWNTASLAASNTTTRASESWSFWKTTAGASI